MTFLLNTIFTEINSILLDGTIIMSNYGIDEKKSISSSQMISNT